MRVPLMILGLLLLFTFVGCGDDTDPEAGFDEPVDTAAPLRIVKGEHGHDYPEARFEIVTPAPDEVVTGDSITVTTKLMGVELKAPTEGEGANGLAYSKDGQHIHVIIDDKPYMAMYDMSFKIGGLAPGMHTLRAFPSRSWHESIKKPDVFVAHTFYVGEKKGDPLLDPTKPLLTYSRPKGEYAGKDGRKVMIDFYLSNAELGPDKYKVIASIDGQVMDTLTEWVPYYIEGLKPGEHTVGLKLIGPDGNVVPNGPFNDVQQTITIKKEESVATTEASELEKDVHDAMRHSSGK